nr:hypothetical protein [Tanacetum cinerariifolium]
MYHQKNVDYVELLWEDFIYQIDNKAYKKQEKMYYPRFTRVIIHYFLTQDKTVSSRNKIGMHTSKDDYLINTLRFVSTKEATRIYGAILPESLTSLEIKETKAYQTYFGFATRATPPKKERKFKKHASLQLTIVPVSSEEPTKESKRAKRSAKKFTKALMGGFVIRETPEIPLSKKKEKVDVARGKGIKLLSEVALTEEAQHEEGNNEDDSNNKQDSRSEGSDEENDSDDENTQSDNEKGSDSEHETDENESGFKSDQGENKEEDETDEEEKEDEYVGTPYYYSPTDDEDKTNVDDNVEGFVQKEGTDAEMINVQQGNENPKISQIIEDAHVTLFTIPRKTKVPVTRSSHSFDLAYKFLNFADIPTIEAEIVSLMDVTSIMKSQKDKDKDEDPSVGSGQGLKKRKTSKDAKLTTGPKLKNQSNTPQQGPTQSCLMTLASSADKQSNTFDELMSTPIDFSAYIMNGLKITNLSQETLLGPSFSLLKGTRTKYVELGYDFEECYKALLEKLYWENLEGVTRVEVTRKHGYGYLKEIEVRRANNDLYTFKEDELYKFSDGTLTRLQTSLEDITKNIHMEYLPKRRWSTLEKKRANIMIKVIDKQLKKRRMTMSLKKFVGERHYETDLRLLQRII